MAGACLPAVWPTAPALQAPQRNLLQALSGHLFTAGCAQLFVLWSDVIFSGLTVPKASPKLFFPTAFQSTPDTNGLGTASGNTGASQKWGFKLPTCQMGGGSGWGRQCLLTLSSLCNADLASPTPSSRAGARRAHTSGGNEEASSHPDTASGPGLALPV